MRYKLIITDAKITKRLKKQNISELARRVGISITYLHKAYRNKLVVTADMYAKISAELNKIEAENDND